MLKVVASGLFASTMLLGAASAVQAADIAPPARDWTGFYIGVGGGGLLMSGDLKAGGSFEEYYENQDYRLDPIVDGNDVTEVLLEEYLYDVIGGFDQSADIGKGGIFGTVELGADYQMDSFVFGIVGNFDLASLKASNSAAGGFSGTQGYTQAYDDADGCYGDPDLDGYECVDIASGGAGAETEVKMENSWGIGLRGGFLATESTLIYGLGGFTQAKFSAETKGGFGFEETYFSGGADGKASTDEWLNGWFLGAGMEQLLTDNVSLKLEYRYANYETLEWSDSSSDSFEYDNGVDFRERGSSSGRIGGEFDPVIHAIRATIAYRF
ncbi:outer membrane protein [Aestuariivirga sp.]|uniref:outer membrane protein n=1 Tax=Aestuariivirga sp. TaxID=2650926 RepID=UPI003918EA15